MSNRKLCVGVITAPRGVQGQVRVKSFTAEPDGIVHYAPLTNAEGSAEYRLEIVGHAKGILLARVEGIKNREDAETLRGVELFVDRDVLPDAEDEDDFYYADLIGLSAILPNGGVYGTVKAMHDFGAGDMIELSLNGSGNIILPFTKVVVPEVDIANGRIVVDPPEMFGDPEPAQQNENGEEDAQ